MLREISAVRQDRPGLKRRWYQDDFFDLYTWQAANGSVVSFQLCYDVSGRERALTWHHQRGFSHNRVDNRTAPGKHAATRRFIQDKMPETGRAVARGPVPALPLRLRRHHASPPASDD